MPDERKNTAVQTPPPIPPEVVVLVKKASIDQRFRDLLLSEREAAARAIGLEMSPEGDRILSRASKDTLRKAVESAAVRPENEAVFLGEDGQGMLSRLRPVEEPDVVGQEDTSFEDWLTDLPDNLFDTLVSAEVG
jgi:hypothetical protein